MREINLDPPPDAAPTNTFLIYGDSRSGKTTFAGSFPRPLFLADATEGGWDSLMNPPEDGLFEPSVKPLVWAIETMTDMAEAMAKAAPLIAQGRVKTIVIDSLTFYTDLYLASLLRLQGKPDMRQIYGTLGNHLRDLRVQMHGLGCNIVWLALTKHPSEDDPMGGPMIPGQQAAKFMAGVHYVFHARTHQEKRGQELLPMQFQVRTRKFMNYIAGNRLGALAASLPDPLVGTYATLLDALGYDIDAVRGKPVPPVAPVRAPVVARAPMLAPPRRVVPAAPAKPL